MSELERLQAGNERLKRHLDKAIEIIVKAAETPCPKGECCDECFECWRRALEEVE